jgi:hypothetical protein
MPRRKQDFIQMPTTQFSYKTAISSDRCLPATNKQSYYASNTCALSTDDKDVLTGALYWFHNREPSDVKNSNHGNSKSNC